jgi:hypothetical protein
MSQNTCRQFLGPAGACVTKARLPATTGGSVQERQRDAITHLDIFMACDVGVFVFEQEATGNLQIKNSTPRNNHFSRTKSDLPI